MGNQAHLATNLVAQFGKKTPPAPLTLDAGCQVCSEGCNVEADGSMVFFNCDDPDVGGMLQCDDDNSCHCTDACVLMMSGQSAFLAVALSAKQGQQKPAAPLNLDAGCQECSEGCNVEAGGSMVFFHCDDPDVGGLLQCDDDNSCQCTDSCVLMMNGQPAFRVVSLSAKQGHFATRGELVASALFIMGVQVAVAAFVLRRRAVSTPL